MTAKAVLYYAPMMEGLARRIVEANPDIALSHIDWQRFSDGESNIDVCKVDGARNLRGAFLVSMESDAEKHRQISAAYWIAAKAGTVGLKVLMPFFPGQMDRSDTISKVITAKTLAIMLSACPRPARGGVEYVMYDIHSLHTENYFDLKQVRTRLKTGTKYLKRELHGQDVDIWFPDKGGYNRFKGFFDGSKSDGRVFPMGFCDKDRISETERRVVIKEGDPRGRHCLIVDDIIQSGNTILECKDRLLAAGAAKVSCYATHWVCPNDAWKRFIDVGFEKVYATDTFPKTVNGLYGVGQFKVLSMALSLSNVILDLDDEAVGPKIT